MCGVQKIPQTKTERFQNFIFVVLTVLDFQDCVNWIVLEAFAVDFDGETRVCLSAGPKR